MDFRIAGSQVDQIVDVDYQWVNRVAPASGLKMADLDGIRCAGAPHARAGRENLKGLSADFGGAQRHLFERTKRVQVQTQAQKFILSKPPQC